MKLSHTKLQTILECPMTYFLNYKEGIKLKEEKSALAIGSAVHWGIEHNTDDLEEYYNEEEKYIQYFEVIIRLRLIFIEGALRHLVGEEEGHVLGGHPDLLI